MIKFAKVASLILASFLFIISGCMTSGLKTTPQFHSSIKEGDEVIAKSVPVFYANRGGYFAIVDSAIAKKITGGGKFSVPAMGAGGTLRVERVSSDTLWLNP